MDTGVIVAIITGAFTFAGVLVTVIYGNKAHRKTSKEQTELTLYRIDQLERKVNLHNNAVERLYRVEGEINELQHEMKRIHQKEKVS